MSIDLSSVKGEGSPGELTFRLGIDAEKTAQLLEGLAAQIRAGNVIPKQAKVSSIFASDEWESGELVFTFNEKVEI